MEKVAKLSQLRRDRGLKVTIGETQILLALDGDAVRAFSAVCPHAGGPLDEGALCNGRIICPWHKGSFALADGALLEPPALEGLARYPVRIDGEDVYVSAEAREQAVASPARDARTFVIVGAGAAGGTAAAALREFGFDGRIVLVGREAGLPFDRTSLSKFVVSGEMGPSEIPLLLPPEFYDAHNIERIQASVSRLDVARRQVEFWDGATLAFDRALIATGGEPKELDVPGSALPGVHVLRSRESALAILAGARRGARAVILGGSFIGLEVASALRKREVEVSVVSPHATPFVKQFGERIGKAIKSMHESHGVAFHAGTRAVRLEGRESVEAVVLEDGSRLPAELVVVGVGVRPATEFMVGSEVREDGGLDVDASMRFAEGIYAAGDIAAFPWGADGARVRIEHWRVAQQQARVAARNMIGAEVSLQCVPFFWTYHYDQNFEYLGHPDRWDEEVVVGDVEQHDFVTLLLQQKSVVGVVACGHERATAALAERMRAPLAVQDALEIISAM